MNVRKFAVFSWFVASLSSAGCNTSEPTTAVLSNDYPVASDAETMAVYRGWWSVAQFAEPVLAGQVSDPIRVVRGSDYGYALLAPGWEPALGYSPATLIPLRSAEQLSVDRGELLTFRVSPSATVGDCAAGSPLTQEDADFITQRIFPVEFSGLVYDAASCSTSAIASGEGGAGGEAGAP